MSSGLGGRGAAASAHSATLASHGATMANHGATRAAPIHAPGAIAGKHAEHSTSQMAGMDHHHHHHHPFRREPLNDYEQFPQFFPDCIPGPDPLRAWPRCDGPTKNSGGTKRHS